MSDIQEQIKLAHKRAEENDIKEIQRQNGMTLGEEQQLYWEDFKNPNYDDLLKENKKLKKLCDKYEEEHKTTFEEWKKDINIIDEFDKWLIGEKMMFYKSNDGERLIRFGETKNKWLELKGDNK